MHWTANYTIWTVFAAVVAMVAGIGVWLAVHRPNKADDRRYAPRHELPDASAHGGLLHQCDCPDADDDYVRVLQEINAEIRQQPAPRLPEWDFERWQAGQDAWLGEQQAEASRIWETLECGVWADPWWTRRAYYSYGR